MAEKRTQKQIDADRLDLAIYRLTDQVQRFSDEHRDSNLQANVAHLNGLRMAVRRQMHPKDREKTNA